jgi:uncharacterized RDD family membrane protein YckC
MGGATLGKRVFHLRSAQFGTGAPPRAIESFVRAIVKTVSLAAWVAIGALGFPFLLLNLAPIFFNRTRRAGHDFMARTLVTRDPLPLSDNPSPASFDEE